MGGAVVATDVVVEGMTAVVVVVLVAVVTGRAAPDGSGAESVVVSTTAPTPVTSAAITPANTILRRPRNARRMATIMAHPLLAGQHSAQRGERRVVGCEVAVGIGRRVREVPLD